jgi:hypothetical protein
VSLAAKLAEIYVEVDRFAKSKKVTGTGPSYSYTPVEEIADYLRKAMGERGVVMVPSSTEVYASEDAGTTKSGTTRWRHIVRVDWTITDGTDSLSISSVGESMDTGDKGMNKAQTAARKYALIGAFQLSTGDDPDRSHPEPASYRSRPKAPVPTAPKKGSDTTALAQELMATAGKENEAALLEALRGAGISSADLADEKTLAKARSLAEGVAALSTDPLQEEVAAVLAPMKEAK